MYMFVAFRSRTTSTTTVIILGGFTDTDEIVEHGNLVLVHLI